MKIAIAGGTGIVGRHVVAAATHAGHDVTVISRAHGVDVGTGAGLEAALRGIDAVVDVTNVGTLNRAKATRFFETATSTLLAAERMTGVGHHVALSIVGIDRVSTGYYAAKLRQEELVAAGDVPWTVLRATQFHDFAAQMLGRVKGPVVPMPRMRSATVAAREVGAQLVELATGEPCGRASDMTGPEVHDMVDLVRRTARAARRRCVVVPLHLPGRAGALTRGDGLLPVGPATTGTQTFAQWLRAEYGDSRTT